ncbi:uncharacterized protein LOC134227183 isoform X1 [Armigeres subalbatus]|uniref:uncharacterized protein LOC134227183 isoform X1 n=1 Tax=Armigeres subalbatus TaxID=124917 RepID=UPI002ED2118C
MEAVRSNSKWNRWQIKNGTKQVDGNLTSFVTACSQKNAVKAAISIEDETDVIERCLLRPQLNIRMFCTIYIAKTVGGGENTDGFAVFVCQLVGGRTNPSYDGAWEVARSQLGIIVMGGR